MYNYFYFLRQTLWTTTTGHLPATTAWPAACTTRRNACTCAPMTCRRGCRILRECGCRCSARLSVWRCIFLRSWIFFKGAWLSKWNTCQVNMRVLFGKYGVGYKKFLIIFSGKATAVNWSWWSIEWCHYCSTNREKNFSDIQIQIFQAKRHAILTAIREHTDTVNTLGTQIQKKSKWKKYIWYLSFIYNLLQKERIQRLKW